MIATTAKRAYAMLENQSLWDTAELVHLALTGGGVPHAVVGGVAVCLHGYQRNTVDVDWLVRREDVGAIQTLLEAAGLLFDHDSREFVTASGVAVQFVLAGDREGPGQTAVFPDPGDAGAVTVIDDLPVLTLAALIQSKLASGLGSLRRTHKDFADVVELIAIHNLDGSFAPRLDKSVRPEFKELVKRARA